MKSLGIFGVSITWSRGCSRPPERDRTLLSVLQPQAAPLQGIIWPQTSTVGGWRNLGLGPRGCMCPPGCPSVCFPDFGPVFTWWGPRERLGPPELPKLSCVGRRRPPPEEAHRHQAEHSKRRKVLSQHLPPQKRVQGRGPPAREQDGALDSEGGAWLLARLTLLCSQKAENIPAETWQTLPHPSDQGQYHQW